MDRGGERKPKVVDSGGANNKEGGFNQKETTKNQNTWTKSKPGDFWRGTGYRENSGTPGEEEKQDGKNDFIPCQMRGKPTMIEKRGRGNCPRRETEETVFEDRGAGPKGKHKIQFKKRRKTKALL